MKKYVAINKSCLITHYFDSEQAVNALLTMDNSAWVRSGEFTIIGKVSGMVIKDIKSVYKLYGI